MIGSLVRQCKKNYNLNSMTTPRCGKIILV